MSQQSIRPNSTNDGTQKSSHSARQGQASPDQSLAGAANNRPGPEQSYSLPMAMAWRWPGGRLRPDLVAVDLCVESASGRTHKQKQQKQT